MSHLIFNTCTESLPCTTKTIPNAPLSLLSATPTFTRSTNQACVHFQIHSSKLGSKPVGNKIYQDVHTKDDEQTHETLNKDIPKCQAKHEKHEQVGHPVVDTKHKAFAHTRLACPFQFMSVPGRRKHAYMHEQPRENNSA